MGSFTYGKKRYGSRGYRGLVSAEDCAQVKEEGCEDEEYEDDEEESTLSPHSAEVTTYMSPEEEFTLDHPEEENQEVTEVGDDDQGENKETFDPVNDEPTAPEGEAVEPVSEVTTVDEVQDVPEDQESCVKEIMTVLADNTEVGDETLGAGELEDAQDAAALGDEEEKVEAWEPTVEEIAQDLATMSDPICVNQALERLQREDPEKHSAVLDALNKGVSVTKEVTPPTPADNIMVNEPLIPEKTTADHKAEIEARSSVEETQAEEYARFNTDVTDVTEDAAEDDETGSVDVI